MTQASLSSSRFSIADAVGSAIVLYADNFKLFFLSSLAAAIVPIVMGILDNTGNELLQGLWFVFLPFAFCFQVIVLLALIQMIAKRSLNEDVDAGILFQDALLIFWKGAGSILLFGLILVVGILLLVIPFFYWSTIFFFFLYFISLEEARMGDAFKLSEQLVSGQFILVFQAHIVVVLALAAIFLPIIIGLFLIGVDGMFRSIIFHLLIALVVPSFLGFYYSLFCWLKKSKAPAGTISVYDTK
ncbi:MAG: hypothetical protein HQL21_09160 [Candidatus Omnitrophica bacterium]|nr:hypothetical protein [Candidatus Omnitrophota bacterium]